MASTGSTSSWTSARNPHFLSGASAVDLFCGVGGLTYGLIESGIPVNAGFDIDGSCRYAFERNNKTKFIQYDIGKLTSQDVAEQYPEDHIKILVGCAPCQPFSAYAQRYKDKVKDQRWSLLYSFARIIRGIEPEIISMENVPLLTKYEPFVELLATLKKMRYNVAYHNIRCELYGVPQKRTRLVLLASRLGDIDIIPPTHEPGKFMTVRDAIGHLEKIKAGQSSKKDPLHRAQKLSELNKRRLLNSTPGGTWRDWDSDLICPCHTKESGSSYASVYGRMSWDEPSPTITTNYFNYGSGRFGHPEQTRALSLREGAILQSFPDDYEFIATKEPVHFKRIATHIGNAVPVRIGKIIGQSIVHHLEGCANA